MKSIPRPELPRGLITLFFLLSPSNATTIPLWKKAILLVNGEEVGDFRDKQITIKVSPGDIISIDGSFYIHELVFKVVAVSENVGQPEIGQIIFVQGDISMVGEVRMK